MALKFLLHLVGDLHQPLHASDDHDRGGNDKRVSAAGMRSETLHHYWDTEFVEQLGANPQQIATMLIAHISARDAAQLGARQSGRLGDGVVHGCERRRLWPASCPSNTRGKYRLTEGYIAMADRDVTLQLSKAGVRLADLLNRALGQGNKE